MFFCLCWACIIALSVTDLLILTEFQPVPGYSMPKGEGIVFILRS